jgi:hypothetical protein
MKDRACNTHEELRMQIGFCWESQKEEITRKYGIQYKNGTYSDCVEFYGLY